MFDNLIGQGEVLDLLAGDIRGGKLPPSILLSGPPASGKLTTALELARLLSCQAEEVGAWNCICASCARHRSLVHPDLLLFGRRSFPEEIPAALDTLRAAPGKAGAFFFLRSVRKLVKRFEPTLWDGEESKLAKAAGLVNDLEERLAFIAPESAPGGVLDAGWTAKALKAAEETVPLAAKLEAFVPDMPPVSQVRAVEHWARLAPWGRRKAVVIENAEAMNESARNALLKILEEPPASVVFVLVTPRRQAMMRTILSRVRTYPFAARDVAASREVLEKVFRADVSQVEGGGPAILSPERWLASKRVFPPELARQFAMSLLAAVLAERLSAGCAHGRALREAGETASSERLDIASALAATFSATKDLGQKDDSHAASLGALLSALEDSLGEILRGPEVLAGDIEWMRRVAGLCRETRLRRDSFNLPAPTLLETLAYKMRDSTEGGQ